MLKFLFKFKVSTQTVQKVYTIVTSFSKLKFKVLYQFSLV